jgi:hypothetical protein
MRTVLAENYSKLGLTDTAAQKMLAGMGKAGVADKLPLEVLAKLLAAVSRAMSHWGVGGILFHGIKME